MRKVRLRAGEERRGTEAATDTLGSFLSSPDNGELLSSLELQASPAKASLDRTAEV